MGLYPRTEIKDKLRHTDGTETWIEEYDDYSGVVRYRKITAQAWKDRERTDCYCCSCGDRPGCDPYCRNHGHAGERPCEVHQMPGTENEDGVMPDSVQQYRKG